VSMQVLTKVIDIRKWCPFFQKVEACIVNQLWGRGKGNVVWDIEISDFWRSMDGPFEDASGADPVMHWGGWYRHLGLYCSCKWICGVGLESKWSFWHQILLMYSDTSLIIPHKIIHTHKHI
jgi:hypothetical protein